MRISENYFNMKPIGLRFLFFTAFLGSLLFSTNLQATWTVRVLGECDNTPLVGYPVRISSGSSFVTRYTGFGGWLSYNPPSSTTTIRIGGSTYTSNTGGYNLGTRRGFSVWGDLTIGSTTLWSGNVMDVSVQSRIVSECNESNRISFTNVNTGSALQNIFMKIKISRVLSNGFLVSTLVIPVYSPMTNASWDMNSLMAGWPSGRYVLTVELNCCALGGREPARVKGHNIFEGAFMWEKAIEPTLAQFEWRGSSITETVNNDGVNNNAHPNNGNIWQLGQTSAGVSWLNNFVGSQGARRITYRLEKSQECLGAFEEIWTRTIFPINGQTINGLTFNSEMANYFAFGGPFINFGTGNVRNTFFPVRYQYNDCFRFTAEISSSSNCPPSVASGIFKIHDGDASARGVGAIPIEVLSPMEISILENDFDLDRNRPLDGIRIQLYPNPALDFVKVSGIGSDNSLRLFSQDGKEVQLSRNGDQIDLQLLNAGVYILRILSTDGQLSTHKIVKL